MKRLLFILLTLIYTSIQMMAQIKVVDFKLQQTDMTANTYGTSKVDQNGETAALIKIVTPEKELVFDGGSLGIVGTEFKTGEIWLYVPRRSQKLTINSQKFGKLTEWFYPISIEGGRTYEMLLDIGTGRYVTITTTRAKSDVTIDGEYVGKSPIYNRYMNFGPHTIVAQNDRFEGSTQIDVVPMDSTSGRQVNVKMLDMSDHYGDVTVAVDNNAEIYFNSRKVGTGSWQTQLREGVYTVETRMIDCEPARTSFTVLPKQKNEIKATAPTPYTGYLDLVMRTTNVKAVYNGSHSLNLEEPNILPIGTYLVDFSKKGYEPLQREYTILRNETTTDTVKLDLKKYVKPLAFYFGAAYSFSSLSGITGILGAVIKGHDIQASYTFGVSKTKNLQWTDIDNGTYLGTMNYSLNTLAIKYGYQFNLLQQLALTPQIGYSYNTLMGNIVDGSTKYGDGAQASYVSIGFKLLLVPFEHCYVFVAPEYNFAISKEDNFTNVMEEADYSVGGFLVNTGILVNF
jgi:hypothetical protein